jgi:glycosyltransferase involved in cell wall biosynthesis
LVTAIELLAGEGHTVRFEQIGRVRDHARICNEVKQRGLGQSVHVRPRLPHDEALRRMEAADLFVVIQPNTSIQVPGKIYEMLMFRKPIVALADDGATADIVHQFNLGVVAPAGDPRQIADAILQAWHRCRSSGTEGGWTDALAAYDGCNLTGELAARFDGLLPRSVPRS